MRLFRKTAFLAAVVSTFACHDTAGPPLVAADFALDNINGRPLPTYLSPIPESPTIVSSTLHLDRAGNATLTQSLRQMGNNITQIATYSYTISGNHIAFGYNCPPNANCLAPPSGTISGDNLSLDMSGGSGAVVYNYLLAYFMD